MAKQHLLGVGLWNFRSAYDAHDLSNSRYGRERFVHSSHFQVLAEMGFFGALLWGALFIVSLWTTLRIRRRAWANGLLPGGQRFLLTMADALFACVVFSLAEGSLRLG